MCRPRLHTSPFPAIAGASSGGAQTVASSDYNRFFKLATPYDGSAQLVITSGNTTKALDGSNDAEADPLFFDKNRNCALWNDIFGDGTNTAAAATSYLAGMNGYRGTPNFDQNGTVTPAVRSMIDWVSYGYSPTNLSLRAAGDPSDGSPDIGAMSVRTKAMVGFF